MLATGTIIAGGSDFPVEDPNRGKRADLIVLNDDVFMCDETRIKDVAPLLTMVGGEIVYERDERQLESRSATAWPGRDERRGDWGARR